MDDIIPDIELVKALNDLSIVLLLSFLCRSVFSAKDIALRHNHKAKLCIGKAFRQPAVAYHDLARLQRLVERLPVKRRQIVLPKITGKTFCSRSRTAEHQNTIALLPPLLHILDQQFKMLIVRSNRLTLQMIVFPYGKILRESVQHCQIQRAFPAEHRADCLGTV